MTAIQALTNATRPSMLEAAWCHSEPHAAFVIDVLKSSDCDGVIRARAGNHSALSMMIGMMMAGWLDRINHGYHTPLAPFRITKDGRDVLAAITACETSTKP